MINTNFCGACKHYAPYSKSKRKLHRRSLTLLPTEDLSHPAIKIFSFQFSTDIDYYFGLLAFTEKQEARITVDIATAIAHAPTLVSSYDATLHLDRNFSIFEKSELKKKKKLNT